MKANYLPVYIYKMSDLDDISRLADQVQEALLLANGYYLASYYPEINKYLNTNMMDLFGKINTEMNKRSQPKYW